MELEDHPAESSQSERKGEMLSDVSPMWDLKIHNKVAADKGSIVGELSHTIGLGGGLGAPRRGRWVHW